MSSNEHKSKKKSKKDTKKAPSQDRIQLKDDSGTDTSDGGGGGSGILPQLDSGGSIRLVPGLSEERSRTMTVMKLSNFFSSGTQVESQDSALHATIARVDRFVDDYEEALSFLLSDIQLPWHEYASFKAANETRLLALEETLRQRSAPSDFSPTIDEVFGGLRVPEAAGGNRAHARQILLAFFDATALLGDGAPELEPGASSSLARLLRGYEALQQALFDPHVEAVYRWWLPQLLELRGVSALLRQAPGALVYAQGLLRYVRASTALACAFLTGAYLRTPPLVRALLGGADQAGDHDHDQDQDKNKDKDAEKDKEPKVPALAALGGDERDAQLLDLERRVSALRRPEALSARRAAADAAAAADAGLSGFGGGGGGGDIGLGIGEPHSFVFERRRAVPLLRTLGAHAELGAAVEAQLKEVPEEFCAALLALRRCGDGYLPAPAEAFAASGPATVRVNRESTVALLEATCRVKEFVEWMRREWPQGTANSPQFLRAMLLLAHQIEFLGGLDTVFCVPSLWQIWLDLVEVLRGVVAELLQAAKDKAGPNDLRKVQNPLATIVVHLRWISSQLLCIQNNPNVLLFDFSLRY